jgi:8-oxo-dGTP diphosphatase
MTSELIHVVAAVIQRAGSYLICQRPLEKRHGGLWEFPGGKQDAGETPFDAVARELREELGVTATIVGPLLYSVHDPGSPFVIQFYPVEISGEPAALEHSELAWLSPEQMRTSALAPSDRAFVNTLLV